MSPSRAIRIGVVVDTHGLFDQALVRQLRGVDLLFTQGTLVDDR